MDFVDEIIAYEAGEMDTEEAIAFFQKLVNLGVVWHLQGSYGRTATHLIEQGLIQPAGEGNGRQVQEG